MKITKPKGQAKQPPLVPTGDGFWSNDKSSEHQDTLLPTVNIIEKKSVYKIKVLAPGFRKKDFNITVQAGDLVITAEHRIEKKEENENYLRKEFSTSSFTRSFNLPDNIPLNQIKANYKDGLLHIAIKKTHYKNKK